jgi:integrating conjugative element protein (TIGR03765 family)
MRNYRLLLMKAISLSAPPADFKPSVSQRWAIGRLVAALLYVVSVASQAATVIFDSGQTVPISQFLAPAFQNSNVSQGAPMRPVAPDAGRAPLPVTFPVRTASMSPGKLLPTTNAVKLQSWLPTAVFLIGTDDMSKAWIVRNRDLLAKQRAAGIVVHADNIEAFRSMQTLGHGLPMAPSSADELAKRLRLNVYPVLIRPDGVIVQ